MDRREFLAAAAAAGASLATGCRLAESSPAEPETPVIDTHMHLWDLGRFELPWTGGEPRLASDHLLADYRPAAEGLGIARSIYMEVDVHPRQEGEEAEWAITLCEDPANAVAGAIISGRPGEPGFREHVGRFADAPAVKGVRRVLHGGSPRGRCLAPAFVEDMQWLGASGLSFDLCMRPGELDDAGRLCREARGTRFILDHCGNPSFQGDIGEWKGAISRIASENDNLVCKVSGFVAHATNDDWTVEQLAAVVEHVRDAFGPERLVFGSDWPVCNLRASLPRWLGALRTIIAAWPEDEQRQLLSENARRVYRLA